MRTKIIKVRLVKRYRAGTKRNGQRNYVWGLRWRDEDGRIHTESTGSADRTYADDLRDVKQRELNGLLPVEPEPEPEPEPAPVSSWKECRDSLDKSMRADNLRPSYISDAVLNLELLERAFPDTAGPAEITPEMASEWKQKRAEGNASPWSIKGDLATIKAAYNRLRDDCRLVAENPFAGVKPPKCDEPDVRIVTAGERSALYEWLTDRWGDWQLPVVYLEVAATVGWRAVEIASLRSVDLLDDGFVQVQSGSEKRRRHKLGWLPPELHRELKDCQAGGWAFGRFSDELRRRLMLVRKQPYAAARVKGFSPKRLVGWLQDEIKRFCDDRVKKAKKDAQEQGVQLHDFPEAFSLHDFRRTLITALGDAGVSEREVGTMVGVTPEVARRHYERLNRRNIARSNVQRLQGGAVLVPWRKQAAAPQGPLEKQTASR
ncbi:MAG: hypothetical protein RIC55_00025 [Pirellulaceae bacterium]